MKKAFLAASLLLLLADIILLKEISFLAKDSYLLTWRNKNVTAGTSKSLEFAPKNAEVEILDKTQLLFMNIP